MEFHFMHASWNLVRQLARENYTENNMFTITNQWMDLSALARCVVPAYDPSMATTQKERPFGVVSVSVVP